jgi:hypothetical protein
MPLFRAPSRFAGLPLSAVSLVFALSLTGCHSAYIAATVSNRTDKPVSLIQVDYPSASFGTQTLAPGQDFHYRFKVLGSGPVKLTYTDTSEHETKSTGPELREGDEGALQMLVTPAGVQWTR